jgi:hypothetical protein
MCNFKLYCLLILSTLHFFIIQAHACVPCPSKLSFDETLKRADLIIIGQRTDYEEREAFVELPQGPDTISVKILDTLKGKAPSDIITVNSWDGICAFGIVADNSIYFMALTKKGPIFDAVNNGCAFKTRIFVNNGIKLKDGQTLKLKELKKRVSTASAPN